MKFEDNLKIKKYSSSRSYWSLLNKILDILIDKLQSNLIEVHQTRLLVLLFLKLSVLLVVF